MIRIKRVKLTDPLSPNPQSYDDAAFEQLFKLHYKALHAYAFVILKDHDTAEEMVQGMFMKFWEKREMLQISTSVKAYLYKCIHNDCLNYLKHEKIKFKHQEHTMNNVFASSEPASAKVEMNDLKNNLSIAMNELPEQCRTIFQMSRFEELKYREIADQLGLSIKTVENQMGKALRILRLKLSDFLVLILLGIMYYKDFFN
ncbi:RNA polymerase sigma-70 factor [Pedobacter sp. PACM 27299]|uniref:RNA polymerase sigma-70 factor n=1 Tax=Pedobacter sp. PACM 27299 TaxID=1727164 RepID=UPI000AB16821|nr:RNA polymerase sigma-70 factor [Pedobacter sp. PACM 27299]